MQSSRGSRLKCHRFLRIKMISYTLMTKRADIRVVALLLKTTTKGRVTRAVKTARTREEAMMICWTWSISIMKCLTQSSSQVIRETRTVRSSVSLSLIKMLPMWLTTISSLSSSSRFTSSLLFSSSMSNKKILSSSSWGTSEAKESTKEKKRVYT